MFSEQTWIARIIWAALLIIAADAVINGRWPVGFVALGTLFVSILPLLVARRLDVVIPPSFVAAVVIFVGGTLFLGEVYDFYERFWWWDVVMHGASAIGFGLMGFVLVFIMFQGDKFAAPPVALAFFAFCFAMTIGAIWEIFEFAMDQIFGLNMQKSGLMDTMSDLIVDMIGAGIGAGVGYLYLKDRAAGGLTHVIRDFIERNPKYFKRFRK